MVDAADIGPMRVLLMSRHDMSISRRVRHVFCHALMLCDDEIIDSELIGKDLAVSGPDCFELVMGLEAEFGLEIEQSDVEGKTVGALVKALQRRILEQRRAENT